MYKMIAFDIDGTILPQKQEKLDDKVIGMFKEIKEAGYILSYVTGRDFITIESMIEAPYVDYFIGADGSFIYNMKTKKIEWERMIKYSQYKVLLDFCKTEGIQYALFAKEIIYGGEGDAQESNPFWKHFSDKFTPLEINEEAKEDIYNVMIISQEIEVRQKVKDFIKNKENLSFDCEWKKGLMVGAKDINKAFGIQRLGDRLSFELSEVISFGDGENDLSMLSQTGDSYAMANGCNNAKEVAKGICLSDVEYGPYKKLKELGII